MSTPLAIRQMTPVDLERALDWAAAEGWNPGVDDLKPFLASDPEGFLVGELQGEPVCCISAVRYSDDYGFIGFYICHPDHRGKGYGKAIWDHAIAHMGARTVGLDGVPAQEESYRSAGFASDYRTIRHGGLAMAEPPLDPRISMLGQGILASVLAYDRPFVPAGRDRFLKNWCSPMADGRQGFIFMENGELRGYGVIRQCREGFKIGPLFADTPDIADALFRALAGQVRGQFVYLDVPEPNDDALALAEKYELSPEFETVRMYKGQTPALALARTYGVTTLELG
jgi:GNAT superfamily N-acetyltransferase